mmetsp:Transcript_31727/g.64559  ORF Transcript_31727/g.64559 Transcript_31727/m.64559 type:complete len:652 (-) Transcript_31727:1893-3848(-)
METCCDIGAVTDHLCPITTISGSRDGGGDATNSNADDATADELDHYHNAYGNGGGDAYGNGSAYDSIYRDLEVQGSAHGTDGGRDLPTTAAAATAAAAASASAAEASPKRNYTDTVDSATDSETDVCPPPSYSQVDSDGWNMIQQQQQQKSSATPPTKSCMSSRRRCALIVLLCLVALGGIVAGVVIATTGASGGGNGSTASSTSSSSSSSAVTVADSFDGPDADAFDGPDADAFDVTDEQQVQMQMQQEQEQPEDQEGQQEEEQQEEEQEEQDQEQQVQQQEEEMPSEDGGNSGTPEDAIDATVPVPVPPVPASPQTCPPMPYISHDADDVLTLSRPNRPDRKFHIYTPANFDFTKPSKIVFMFHGWSRGTFCRGRIFLSSEWRDIADTHNYVLVGVDGLSEGTNESPRSFTFPGSADGVGLDGTTVTTCQTTYGPDYCYPSCEDQGKCNTRCGWTHCLDDDFGFFIDLVNQVAEKYVCVDRSRVYVYGYSMGGMFSWSLGQDPRTAPIIAGMGTVMGLPMHDYLVGKGTASDIPVIGIYGDRDCSVPPGDGSDVYNEVCDDDGYLYVDAFHQHRLWASDHGCSVGMTHPAQYEYNIPGRNEIRCASHCNPDDGVPFSVDCRNDAEHGKEPWHLDAVLKFFEDHYNSRTN